MCDADEKLIDVFQERSDMTMMRKVQTLCLVALVATLTDAFVTAFQQPSWSSKAVSTFQARRSSPTPFVPPSSTRQQLDRRRSHGTSREKGRIYSLQKLVDEVSERSPGQGPSTLFVGGKVRT